MADDTKKNNQPILTDEDIRGLIKSPFESRLEITKKVADYYSHGGFGAEQMQIAEDIFRVLVRDTESEIRKTLAEAIKTSDSIPRDVVFDLAKDVHEVSIPVLEFSEVLTDHDLIEIINTTSDLSKQKSVTKRKTISSSVSDALVKTGNEVVVDSLLNNSGANVSDESYDDIIKTFADKDDVMESVMNRDKLPVTVIENLAEVVSEEIFKKLSYKHDNVVRQLGDSLTRSKTAATMKVIGMQSTEQEYYEFCRLMKKLHVSEDLIPISALCIGNLNLFEVSMACITKVPASNVRTLVFDPSNKGFKVLYERSGLPQKLFQASQALVEILRNLGKDEQNTTLHASAHTSHIILEELMLKVEEQGFIENADYIISLVKHNLATSEGSNSEK